MAAETPKQAALRGFAWGALGGLVLVALMYLATLLFALRPLPQAVGGPVLGLMPGFVFGFLIDTLQHAGKVVEEAGLILAMVIALGVLGGVWAVVARRWRWPQSALVFGGLGWLVVCVVVLPISGFGFLGLNDGPVTPIIWAALFAVFGVVLQMGAPAAAREGETDYQRRRLLGTLPVTIGLVSLGVLALRLVPDWYKAIFSPPEAGLKGVSPAETPTEFFYVVSKNFSDPIVDGNGWRLSLGGSVDKPLSLSLTDLYALPAVTQFVTLECISNNVGGDLMSTGRFTGVSLRDLIASASPRSNGTWAAFRAVDGYAESLPMSLIQGAPEILVAHSLAGQPLPPSHGFPARILIPGHYGMKGPKWLQTIELVDGERGGYWEQQGWDHNAVVKTTARFDVPGDGDIVKLGAVSLDGVAFAGTRGISKVEYSSDGGRTWTAAAISAPLSPLTWVLWHADWTPGSQGSYELKIRATDADGALQDSKSAPSYPSGATGYHTIRVNVAGG